MIKSGDPLKGLKKIMKAKPLPHGSIPDQYPEKLTLCSLTI